MSDRRAFTLIELLIVIAIIALLVSILLPAVASAHRAARQNICTANLQQFGRAYGAYANDFKEFIGSFQGEISDPYAALQHTEHPVVVRQIRYIVNTFDTRRPSFLKLFNSIQEGSGFASVAEQYEHLALWGYASSDMYMPIATCPEDRARLEWRSRPFRPESWNFQPKKLLNSDKSNIEWLPYSSSYQLVPAAAAYSFFLWGNTASPYQQGDTHDTYSLFKVRFGGRRMHHVSFPSGKVAMMDSQQRHAEEDVFYAYPEAKQPLLFWDGSVSLRQTGNANKGWLPRLPETPEATKFDYAPDPGFESPRRTTESVFGYYRWTRSGLHGIDYGGSETRGAIGESRAWHD